MTLMTWPGKQKQTVREVLFAKPARFRKTLWLTGYEFRDIELAIQSQFISKHAEITVVEHDHDVYKAILRSWRERRSWPALNAIHGELKDQQVGKVDFANLDFCGTLSKRLANWLRRLTVLPGGCLYINLCYAKRPSFFMGDAEYELKTIHRDLFEAVATRWKIKDERVVAQVCLLHSIFRNYTFKFLQPIFYCDHINPMTTYRLTEMRPCSPVFPDLLQERSYV